VSQHRPVMAQGLKIQKKSKKDATRKHDKRPTKKGKLIKPTKSNKLNSQQLLKKKLVGQHIRDIEDMMSKKVLNTSSRLKVVHTETTKEESNNYNSTKNKKNK